MQLHTSANNNTSLSLMLHALLKANIRSFKVPDLGTDTARGDGNVNPSLLTMERVIERMVAEGNGNVRYMNGSNVIDIFLQIGHTNLDRNWPYNKKLSKISDKY